MLRNAASEPVLIPFNARADGKDHTGHENDIPIILFTGIHGKASEVHAIAKGFDKLHEGKSPIYICNSSFPENRDAKFIADTILRVRNNSQLPYFLVGYSFGGILANKVAEILQYGYKHPYTAIPYGIDITSPECTQDYFDSDQLSANKDLALIVDHAANLAGLKTFEADQETFKDFQYYFAERKFNALTTRLLAQQDQLSPEKEQRFNLLTEIVRQNLAHLTITAPYFNHQLKSGRFFFTNETIAKHPHLVTIDEETLTETFTGGWDKCCESVQILHSDNGLEDLTHLDLVKEPHAESMARLIDSSMRLEVQEALKSIFPEVVATRFQGFQGIQIQDGQIAVVEQMLLLLIKNSFQNIHLDDESISVIASKAVKLMTENNFRKEASSSQTRLLGQHYGLFPSNASVAVSGKSPAKATPDGSQLTQVKVN